VPDSAPKIVNGKRLCSSNREMTRCIRTRKMDSFCLMVLLKGHSHPRALLPANEDSLVEYQVHR